MGSRLRTVDRRSGYLIDDGTSFLLALAYGEDGPEAKVFLTHSDTEDCTEPRLHRGHRTLLEEDWRGVAFTEADVAKDTKDTKATITARG